MPLGKPLDDVLKAIAWATHLAGVVTSAGEGGREGEVSRIGEKREIPWGGQREGARVLLAPVIFGIIYSSTMHG